MPGQSELHRSIAMPARKANIRQHDVGERQSWLVNNRSASSCQAKQLPVPSTT
jgi:hypothetical protein